MLHVPLNTTWKKTSLVFALLLLFAVSASAQEDGTNYVAGEEAGASLIGSGEFNTIVGDSAGFALRTGDDNTLFGYRAGRTLTGIGNVHIGVEAGFLVEGESRQVLVGYRAGYHADDSELTYIGSRAGFNGSSSLFDNTFVGYAAGCGNQFDDDNTYVGYKAGSGPINGVCDDGEEGREGQNNTFIGSLAGHNIQSTNQFNGLDNTALGSHALMGITTGFRNTALGDSAGVALTTGHNNTFLGQAAGANTRTGVYNTFVGGRAGLGNGTGETGASRNTYVGFEAGRSNHSGDDNVGMGYGADFTSTGTSNGNDRNIFLGADASLEGIGSTGIDDNVLLGYSTRSTVNHAIAIGSGADVTGASGIAIGKDADLDAANSVIVGPETSSSGTNGIALGYQARVTAANAIGIGNGTTVSAANEAYVGNAATMSIGGIVNWTATSDARLKTDVRDSVPGLAFVRQLRPVRYHFDLDALRSLMSAGADVDDALLAKSQTWQTGFLAQEVAEAAQATGFAFSGVVAPVAGRPYYGLRYAEFVVPLTQAVQELDGDAQARRTDVEALTAEIAALEKLAAQRAGAIARQQAQLDEQEGLLARYKTLIAPVATAPAMLTSASTLSRGQR